MRVPERWSMAVFILCAVGTAGGLLLTSADKKARQAAEGPETLDDKLQRLDKEMGCSSAQLYRKGDHKVCRGASAGASSAPCCTTQEFCGPRSCSSSGSSSSVDLKRQKLVSSAGRLSSPGEHIVLLDEACAETWT
eukprot:SM000219S06674  [mRNA]  locus=s219:52381:53335:+ [translate_table: standard]